jgi:hypothetical protein
MSANLTMTLKEQERLNLFLGKVALPQLRQSVTFFGYIFQTRTCKRCGGTIVLQPQPKLHPAQGTTLIRCLDCKRWYDSGVAVKEQPLVV